MNTIFCNSCQGVIPEALAEYHEAVRRAPIPAWARPPVFPCDCAEAEAREERPAMTPYRALLIADGETEADARDSVDAWRYLANSGMLETLPGRYGRTFRSLLDDGALDD
jgi:hypothetical protein